MPDPTTWIQTFTNLGVAIALIVFFAVIILPTIYYSSRQILEWLSIRFDRILLAHIDFVESTKETSEKSVRIQEELSSIAKQIGESQENHIKPGLDEVRQKVLEIHKIVFTKSS